MSSRGMKLLLTAGVVLGAWVTSVSAEMPPLIPREVIFGNPDRSSVNISPDGKYLSWLAPVDGVMNVWVAPREDRDSAQPITKDATRGIQRYAWTYSKDHLVYMQDVGGDENFHVYSVNVETKNVIDLTPIDGVAAQINAASEKFPDEILIGINDRSPQFHDVYRVNLKTGERELLEMNTGFASFLIDDDYRVRFGLKFGLKDGGILVQSKSESGEWQDYDTIPMEDTLTTEPVDFTKDGTRAYLIDSRGRDTAALVEWNLATKEKKLIAKDDRADITSTMLHPRTKKLEAVASTYDRTHWQFFDEAIEKEFQEIGKLGDGEIAPTSRTLEDDYWIVSQVRDDGPVNFYLYDRKTKKAEFLFTNRKELESLTLSPMHPVVIKSRDGLNLVSYLSLLPGQGTREQHTPSQPLPMVLFVHGGPWARDGWGINGIHQWLANRGYAVLSVNFRGSTGFGKSFLNAGNQEWGRKMHNDLLDAVQWAIEQKIADGDKVAIMGGSYGGYATLVGVAMTPDVFACGVDIVGPSNIVTLLRTIPPYWMPQIQMFKDRVGDHTTEEGREFLASRSPLTYASDIKVPLLIGQGANDPRVKQSESDQIVQAMQSHGIPVSYVLYSDEGHGFARPENRKSFFAIAEAFLAEHLGGRFEPIGDALSGSSTKVPAGADQVPGLSDALGKGVQAN